MSFPVVGIGASAGGLDACKALVGAMPPVTGMAFILVQHLDPTHDSMMVELLAGLSSLSVLQASDGLPVEREHLYTIPPDAFLTLVDGVLRLSRPTRRHGARLPFDVLLKALAEDCGPLACCVVLSGSGSDGSLGAKAVKAAGGFVVVQEPEGAQFGGMPRHAIDTGMVDRILAAHDIPAALIAYGQSVAGEGSPRGPPALEKTAGTLEAILDLLRTRISADFTSYKRGTLHRRVGRRMALTDIGAGGMARYLESLDKVPGELDLLARDLLIHTTGFFRDRAVFALLEEETVPDLLRACAAERSVRVWVAGCSTGEETYSLAMLLRERITAEKLDVKLQIFASDIDPQAIATAREGLYASTLEADVSPARLSRFFAREDQSYRIAPELRAAVVFTVQDVLVDPPFSRLDMISCRNLLIYLDPTAQAKVISLFHFALKPGGILLLGTAETVGRADDRFAVQSKVERLYRKVGRTRATDLGFLAPPLDGMRATASRQAQPPRPHQAALADICRRAVLDTYAPAAVLINRRGECLYHLGRTDDYLRISPGFANHDLLEMARQGTRTKLRTAIHKARAEAVRVVLPGGRTTRHGATVAFDIAVQPIAEADDDLLLVSFVDRLDRIARTARSIPPEETTRMIELERDLETTRAELHGAIRDLETSSEDQKAINEEALSFNEEYQSTNEELITSKEELQSFNEELTALNGQLQETLEKQRTTSNDLQNVLYSTDVATLFLDVNLQIRFFTPATTTIFSVIPGDVGRPLADLRSHVADTGFDDDAREVMRNPLPKEREVEAHGGAWFNRRILPYRGHDGAVEGVVITFTDVTDRKHGAEALEAAKRVAEQATLAKSRFLAAASHDLRQPLQTLSLIRGLLAKGANDEASHKLVDGLAGTLAAMSGMLDTLLDVNQIEAGTVRPDVRCFAIGDILDRLRDEFTYDAQAQALALRVVRCRLAVESDQHLLEQMIRNLLSNALKYTPRGKVLLGCRRCDGALRIEIWDTGTGIARQDLDAIFDEYHQLDNAARERARGLGLGLAIVQSLGRLLGHRIHVRSWPERGSVFSIEVRRPDGRSTAPKVARRRDGDARIDVVHRTGAILLVEDDPEIRDLLALVLSADGHRVAAAADGAAALALVADTFARPDLILADYNLPGGMTGLDVATEILAKLRRRVPVVILTGDISTDALRAIGNRDCLTLNKPVQAETLLGILQSLLAPVPEIEGAPPRGLQPAIPDRSPTLIVVDDDPLIRSSVRGLFEADGYAVEDYGHGEAFLAAYRPRGAACLLLDACLPGLSGLEILASLRSAGHALPAIMITGRSDVAMAIGAMKAGASDFIEKPASPEDLRASVKRALDRAHDASERLAWREQAAGSLAGLTSRQHQVMELVLAGDASKIIAFKLGISQRTVENHRASVMRKTGSKSLPALARLALAANTDVGDPVVRGVGAPA